MNLFNIIATAAKEAAPAVDAAAPAADAAAAPAADAAAQPAPSWLTFLPFIILIVAMFYMTARSQKKQQAKRNEMMARLVKGSKVILASGIMGTIVEVKEKAIKVEIASNCIIEVLPSAIVEILADETAEAAK